MINRGVRDPLAYVRAERGWTYQDLVDVIARHVGNMARRREKAWRWEHCGVVPDEESQYALAVPQMKEQGYGRIVNLTSHLASLSTMRSNSPSYRVSKTALNGLTRVLADELHEHNILVNAASPGIAKTRMSYGKATQTPEEAASTMLWLATLPNDGPTGGLFHGHEALPW